MKDPAGTRNKIIEVTERLFAEGGEAATSIRSITREARVNVAAVQYHFGGRDGLLRVVLDRAVEPINRRRLELLDQAQAEHSGAIPVEVLLTSFLRPDLDVLAELRRDRVQVARFLGRAYTQPSPSVASFADQQFEPVFDRFFALLRRALPRSDPEELVQRMRLIVAVVTNLFATAADLHHAGPLGTDDVDEQLRRLLAFCLPGLVAPTGKGTMP